MLNIAGLEEYIAELCNTLSQMNSTEIETSELKKLKRS